MNFNKTQLLLLIVFILFLSACTSKSKRESFTSDPILTIGHGAIIGSDGNIIAPEADFIIAAQKHYIKTIWDGLKKDKPEAGADIEKIIYSAVDDKVLANALFLDWLLEKTETKNASHLFMINNSLRWYYVLNIQQDPILPQGDEDWAKGIEFEIAIKLEFKGLNVFVQVKSGGAQYRQECVDAGVPIPDEVFSDEWEDMGDLTNRIVFSHKRRALKMYVSTDPPGFCLSLSTYLDGSRGHLDVICFGTQTNNSCFFETPLGDDIELEEATDLSDISIPGNNISTCTNCHAGENAFIVHPEDPAFVKAAQKKGSFFGTSANLMGTGWYKPLVPNNWPRNPGPSDILESIPAGPTGRKCTICHTAGGAGGRFPDLSNPSFSYENSGYCYILEHTLGTNLNFPATMPMGDIQNIGKYLNDINHLRIACGTEVDGGFVSEVDFPNDRSFVSPPTVIDPLYQCATQLAVRGSHLNAEVALFINEVEQATIALARNPDELIFSGFPSLLVGDKVKVRQRIEGSWSGFSPIVIVRDHIADFPGGLPTPTVDPLIIYECATVIAVRHVPGAKITVYVNGESPRSFQTATGWTQINPAKSPFTVGDLFTVEASLCDDKSPLSSGVKAIAAPATMPNARPISPHENQEIVRFVGLTHGSRVSIEKTGIGPIGSFTTAVTTKNFILSDPVTSTDQLEATQELCDINSVVRILKPSDCDELLAPRVRDPFDGENFVIATAFELGARIRVYDELGVELGDGIGSVLMLNRELEEGEIISVVQQLGNCTSRLGYVTTVR